MKKGNEARVEIVYEPWKVVVVHEIVQYDLQMLVHLHSLGVQAGQFGKPINWANGVAFEHQAMPPSEEVIKEQIQGRVHWTSLSFAFMPKHLPLITIPEGNVKVPILDLSDNKIFRDMAEWIKKHYKPK